MPLGGPELLVIVVLVLVLFGPDKLPELARGLGKGMREIRKITSEFQSQLSALADLEDERPKPPARSRPPQRQRPAAATSSPSRPVYREPDNQDDLHDRPGLKSDFEVSAGDDAKGIETTVEQKRNDQPSLF